MASRTGEDHGGGKMSKEAHAQVRCWQCDKLIKARDTDAVVHAFLRHGQEKHGWSHPEHPEEAIANHARNYAEGLVRLTGGTERLSRIGDVTVHPATEGRLGDWLRFFDHDGFADNLDWAPR